MVAESNQNVFLILIDASSFAEFEISEFQISRFDCISSFSILSYHNVRTWQPDAVSTGLVWVLMEHYNACVMSLK